MAEAALKETVYEIDASGLHYQNLNQDIHELLDSGVREIMVKNVAEQRFIRRGIKGGRRLTLAGVPGNNLGSYMDGMYIEVLGNCQDGIGNTMNDGTIVVHGHVGEIVGCAMRGELFTSEAM